MQIPKAEQFVVLKTFDLHKNEVSTRFYVFTRFYPYCAVLVLASMAFISFHTFNTGIQKWHWVIIGAMTSTYLLLHFAGYNHKTGYFYICEGQAKWYYYDGFSEEYCPREIRYTEPLTLHWQRTYHQQYSWKLLIQTQEGDRLLCKLNNKQLGPLKRVLKSWYKQGLPIHEERYDYRKRGYQPARLGEFHKPLW